MRPNYQSEIETRILYGTLVLKSRPKSETVLTFDLKSEQAKFYGLGAVKMLKKGN